MKTLFVFLLKKDHLIYKVKAIGVFVKIRSNFTIVYNF
jgi:hypothetical protein